ncbi:MAG: DUF371 domain-containing protein [Thermoprotei archaeon]|nr:MAG: DUF371 domain-containing protein [Thermoprotei archaeon]
MLAIDVVKARGHENVKALHRTTLEITRDEYLTPRGECIVGISANKAATHLSEELRDILRRRFSVLIMVLEVEGDKDLVVAQGSPRLTFTDERRMVIRKSGYIAGDTIGVYANKAARDVSRSIVNKLRQGKELTVYLIAIDVDQLLRSTS